MNFILCNRRLALAKTSALCESACHYNDDDEEKLKMNTRNLLRTRPQQDVETPRTVAGFVNLPNCMNFEKKSTMAIDF